MPAKHLELLPSGLAPGCRAALDVRAPALAGVNWQRPGKNCQIGAREVPYAR